LALLQAQFAGRQSLNSCGILFRKGMLPTHWPGNAAKRAGGKRGIMQAWRQDFLHHKAS